MLLVIPAGDWLCGVARPGVLLSEQLRLQDAVAGREKVWSTRFPVWATGNCGRQDLGLLAHGCRDVPFEIESLFLASSGWLRRYTGMSTFTSPLPSMCIDRGLASGTRGESCKGEASKVARSL